MANIIRIKRGENILDKNITLMAGELALDTATGVLYTSMTDGGNPVEIKGAASGTVSKAETADYADKLSTAQLIKLTGDVTGEASFDGAQAAEITAVLADITTGKTVNGITFNNKGLITAASEVDTTVYIEDIEGFSDESAFVHFSDVYQDLGTITSADFSPYSAGTYGEEDDLAVALGEAVNRVLGQLSFDTRGTLLINDTVLGAMMMKVSRPGGRLTIVSDLTWIMDGVLFTLKMNVDGAEVTEENGYLHYTFPSDHIFTITETTVGYDDTAVLAELDRKANRSALQSYTTTEDMNELLAAKADATSVYTKEEINTTLTGYATDAELKTVSDNLGTANTALEGKADKATTLAGYGITDSYTKTEVNGMVAGTFTFKGSKNSLDELNALTEKETGDVYQVADKEYAYNGTEWVELGFNIDLSAYATTASVNAELDKKADAATVTTLTGNVYTKAEIDGKNYLTEVPSEYITTTELNTALGGYVGTSSVIDGGTF
jgi:hypothetical protein